MNPALPATRKQKILRETRDYLMIALGMIMYGIGWTVFLLPSDIPSGAVPGIASIIYWGTGFPVQYTYLIINFLLLLLGDRWRQACHLGPVQGAQPLNHLSISGLNA